MVTVVQLVEHQVVILGVAGSSPVSHPEYKSPGWFPAGGFFYFKLRGCVPRVLRVVPWSILGCAPSATRYVWWPPLRPPCPCCPLLHRGMQHLLPDSYTSAGKPLEFGSKFHITWSAGRETPTAVAKEPLAYGPAPSRAPQDLSLIHI